MFVSVVTGCSGPYRYLARLSKLASQVVSVGDVHSPFKWFTHLCLTYSVSHISLIKCLGLANFSLAVYIHKCAFRKASAFAHGSSDLFVTPCSFLRC